MDSAPVELLEDVEGPLQAELGVGLDGEREPHVEVVVAEVVVGDAGVGVDDLAARQGCSGSTLAATSIEP